MTNIPAGYQVHITTWENDGDCYATKIISGLTEDDVRFYIELSNKFVSRNGWGEKGLGNGGVESSVLIETISNVLKKHPNVSEETKLNWNFSKIEDPESDVDDESPYETLTELILGWPADEYYWSIDNFCRVVDCVKVYHVPQEVVDVTGKFLK